MSYNYEINSNNQKKKLDQSKYIYKNSENDSQVFIFELILKDKFNNLQVIRRIKNCTQGNLLSSNDNIIYNSVNKYKLTIFDVNYPKKSIIVKELLNHTIVTNTYKKNNIYIEISKTPNNLMALNYHINN